MEAKSGNNDNLNMKNKIKKPLGAIVGPVWDTSGAPKLNLRFAIIAVALNFCLLLVSHLFVLRLDSPEAIIAAFALLLMVFTMLVYPRGMLWVCAVAIRAWIGDEEGREIKHKHIPFSMCLLSLGLTLFYFWLVLPPSFDLSSMLSTLTNT